MEPSDYLLMIPGFPCGSFAMKVHWICLALLLSGSAIADDDISWEQVRIVESVDTLPDGCEWVATVETGFWSSTFTQTGALKKVRKRAAKAGANYLVLAISSSSQSGALAGGTGLSTSAWVAFGEGYSCPSQERPGAP
jgi:hypothetical protein